jgi:thiol-disulfide isomerase/thioredoxin
MTIIPHTCLAMLLSCVALAAADPARTLETAHPGLSTGALRLAVPTELPAGTLVVSGDLTITAADLDKQKADVAPEMAKRWDLAAFMVLENQVTVALLERAATAAGVSGTGEAAIRAYLTATVKDVAVSDAEVATFHAANPDLCTAPLEQMRKDLSAYLADGKKQEAVKTLIADLGKNRPIAINATWVAAQAKLAADNPVDRARASGSPALIDFGADGCRPCDMMTPVLANLKKDFAGKLIVDFVHVRENPILAQRYGVQSIPVQIIFDKAGAEVWRHTGFIPQAQLEAELAKHGVAR